MTESPLATMTGGEAVVATLSHLGIDTIFGIPGVHTLPIYDALVRSGKIRHVLARHEQGAGFMADGYARASGKIGVACTVSGPGATNIATPLASAHSDSVPLLVISSAVSAQANTRLRGELHEIKDQFSSMSSLAGYSRLVTTVEEIPIVLRDAIQVLTTSRPRGAYIEIPYDLLKATTIEMRIPPLVTTEKLRPIPSILAEAVAELREAKRPVIIAGTGVTAAGGNGELLELAELLGSPVVLAAKSHDVAPSDHRLVINTTFLLPPSLSELTNSSDVALVIGSKLGSERTSRQMLPLPERLIHIDIDASEIGNKYPAKIGIVADAKITLRSLLDELQDHAQTVDRSADIETVRAEQIQRRSRIFGESASLLDDINACIPNDAIVVADMTMLGYAAAESIRSTFPRSFINSPELCSIGNGLPMALGAKAARPEQPVIVLCGDGGFLLNCGELATMMQERLPVILIIFNDQAYTAVKLFQRTSYESRFVATDLLCPDFVKLGESFGIRGKHVFDGDGLRNALNDILLLGVNEPMVIEVALPKRV